jgi:hypothetical protein
MKKLLLTLTAMGALTASLLAGSDPEEKTTKRSKVAASKSVSITYETPQKARLIYP